MNKEDMIQSILEKTNVPRKDVELIFNAFAQTVTQALLNGEKVQFVGFGTFGVENRAARVGRNPHTNEEIQIPAKKVPVFRAGRTLKRAVENS